MTPTLPALPRRQPEEVVIQLDEVPTGKAMPVRDLRISNRRDTSLTLSWTTDSATTGYVRFGQGLRLDRLPRRERVVYDSRGATTSSTTHYVVLDKLTPETTYHFEIVSGAEVAHRGTFMALSSLAGLPQPDTVYGQIFWADGTTPAAGTLVYLTLQDADGTASQTEVSLLSALVDSKGYWHANLGNARDASSGESFTYSDSGDVVVLTTQSGTNSTSTNTLDTSDLRPAAPIILPRTAPSQLYLPLMNN